MNSINRIDFQQAIEAGIASSALSAEDQAELRYVGEYASQVGSYFSSGCPATQAFGMRRSVNDTQVALFASGYDAFLIRNGHSGFAVRGGRVDF